MDEDIGSSWIRLKHSSMNTSGDPPRSLQRGGIVKVKHLISNHWIPLHTGREEGVGIGLGEDFVTDCWRDEGMFHNSDTAVLLSTCYTGHSPDWVCAIHP